jgi:hypothetical protein
LIVTIAALGLTLPTGGQEIDSSKNQLQISVIHPTGTVNPGATLFALVTSPTSTVFSHVAITGNFPFSSESLEDIPGVPCRFSITIPEDVSPGKYQVMALGQNSSGQLSESTPSQIDVETIDSPLQLIAEPTEITLREPGMQMPLRIVGHYSDGRMIDLTSSSKILYNSSDPSIAAVNETGTVTGIHTGDAVLSITYEGQAAVASVVITVHSSPLSVSPVALSFESISVGNRGPEQGVTVTNGSDVNLEINDLEITGDFSERNDCVISSPLPPGGICTIYAKFRPNAVGERVGNISIKNNVSILPLHITLVGVGNLILK